MAKQPQFPETLMEAIRYFADPEICESFVASMRWPEGEPVCPICASVRVGRIETRKMYRCKDCRKQFSIKKGTIFEDSPVGLDKWLCAIWMHVNCKNGVSSYEIHRALGVTQKTAWFMGQRIRFAMHQGSFEKKLGGEVEVDETYIGGKARNMRADRKKRKMQARTRGTAGKVIVQGLLERDGDARAHVVLSAKKHVVDPKVRENVEPGTTVFTDELRSYGDLSSEYIHEVINHAEAYVRGNVHTNGMENFWSLLKRALQGTHISVEPYHLFRYLDEQCYRFNTRKLTDRERFEGATRGIGGKRLTYQSLTGRHQGPSPMMNS